MTHSIRSDTYTSDYIILYFSECNTGYCDCSMNFLGACGICGGSCGDRPPPSNDDTDDAILAWIEEVDAVEITSQDIPTQCYSENYVVELHSFIEHGSHFFLAAKNADANNDVCPTALVFASLEGQKVTLHIPNVKDLTNFEIHHLGNKSLLEILHADESVGALDDSEYDLTKNSCAHYAQEIWRSLNIEEDKELGNFIVENLLRDDGLVKYAQKSVGYGGHMVLSQFKADKFVYDKFVRDTVFSQLDIVG